MRANLIMTLGEDYIMFAHAKGLPEGRIFLRYGVRNALSTGCYRSGDGDWAHYFWQHDPGKHLFLSRRRRHCGWRRLAQRDFFVISGAAFFMIFSSALGDAGD